MRQRMPNISTGRDPYNCCACFLVCNANEVILHLNKKKTDKNKGKKNKQNKEKDLTQGKYEKKTPKQYNKAN